LRTLYDYCTQRLTHANLHNDPAAIEEVQRLIAPVADAWRQIGQQPQGAAGDATVAPAQAKAAPQAKAQPGPAPSAKSAVQLPRNPYAARLSAYGAAA